MKLEYRFKSIDWSEALIDYVQSRFEKVKKHELKSRLVQVTFSTERHEKVVEVNIRGLNVHYKAQARTDDFYESVDKVLQKISSQMIKSKDKIQNHKKFSKSHEGRMLVMDEQFDVLKKAS